MVARTAFAPLLVLLASCTEAPTAIVVVTDTDLRVPAEADVIHLEVTSPEGRLQFADANLYDDPHLPRTTTLAWDTGPLGPFVVRAVLQYHGADVLERVARVSFLPGRVVMLRLDLLARCRGVACGPDASCGASGCAPLDVDAAELAAWTGVVPLHLGGPACVPATEVCNGADDNCDGRIDETSDLGADPQNCGGCGHVCATVPHAAASCVLGVCKAACEARFADCNGTYGDGCETSLATVSDCGGCALACAVAHATPSCSTGDCSLSTCAPGWDTCDRAAAMPDVNGCETSVSSDPARCGSCTNACPSPPHAGPTCTSGMCGIVCDSGWADCNARVDDGCETSLADPTTCGECTTSCADPTPFCSGSDRRAYACAASCTLLETACGWSCVDTTQSAENCGGCGRPCPTPAHGAAVCTASTCGVTCDGGYGDCNARVDDGCEVPLVTLTNCGSCGAPCMPAHATGVCGDGSCGIGSCEAGWADCNGRVDDGCEVHVAVDASHCGSCATACLASPAHASPVCGVTGCGVLCQAGFGDCNADPLDGCERDLTTSGDCGACGTACAATFACQRDPLTGVASCVGMCGGPLDPTHTLCGASCTDVTSDRENCGRCARVCPVPAHATPTCAMSACGQLCDAGFGDCDRHLDNGCEIDLSVTVNRCGSCTTSCPSHPNTTPTCGAGACGSRCNTGYADCTTADGCETRLGTMTACTRCGDVCPTSAPRADGSCTSRGCVLECDSDYWDCDGSLANGCELHRDHQSDACAACGHPCSSAERCCTGLCVSGTTCPP